MLICKKFPRTAVNNDGCNGLDADSDPDHAADDDAAADDADPDAADADAGNDAADGDVNVFLF